MLESLFIERMELNEELFADYTGKPDEQALVSTWLGGQVYDRLSRRGSMPSGYRIPKVCAARLPAGLATPPAQHHPIPLETGHYPLKSRGIVAVCDTFPPQQPRRPGTWRPKT